MTVNVRSVVVLLCRSDRWRVLSGNPAGKLDHKIKVFLLIAPLKKGNKESIKLRLAIWLYPSTSATLCIEPGIHLLKSPQMSQTFVSDIQLSPGQSGCRSKSQGHLALCLKKEVTSLSGPHRDTSIMCMVRSMLPWS